MAHDLRREPSDRTPAAVSRSLFNEGRESFAITSTSPGHARGPRCSSCPRPPWSPNPTLERRSLRSSKHRGATGWCSGTAPPSMSGPWRRAPTRSPSAVSVSMRLSRRTAPCSPVRTGTPRLDASRPIACAASTRAPRCSPRPRRCAAPRTSPTCSRPRGRRPRRSARERPPHRPRVDGPVRRLARRAAHRPRRARRQDRGPPRAPRPRGHAADAPIPRRSDRRPRWPMTTATRPKPIEIGPLRASPMDRCREERGVVRWYWRARRKGVRDLVWSGWATREQAQVILADKVTRGLPAPASNVARGPVATSASCSTAGWPASASAPTSPRRPSTTTTRPRATSSRGSARSTSASSTATPSSGTATTASASARHRG
jgi:hypothetical protein